MFRCRMMLFLTLCALLSLPAVAAGPNLGQDRHESQRKGALGEQPPHEIGDLESQEERVSRAAGSEITGEYNIPDKTQNARQDRGGTDLDCGFQQHQCPCLRCAPARSVNTFPRPFSAALYHEPD